ncbi:protein of unknown function [Kyrpidia spormannii]|uniref:Uncharacterized protein n=1 Tax=Kyrpidia spormannii TaxID=2055160 RepID=A0A6F9E3I4_9BACL|nr:protein of unknown function [Kyrpidia spormannii]
MSTNGSCNIARTPSSATKPAATICNRGICCMVLVMMGRNDRSSNKLKPVPIAMVAKSLDMSANTIMLSTLRARSARTTEERSCHKGGPLPPRVPGIWVILHAMPRTMPPNASCKPGTWGNRCSPAISPVRTAVSVNVDMTAMATRCEERRTIPAMTMMLSTLMTRLTINTCTMVRIPAHPRLVEIFLHAERNQSSGSRSHMNFDKGYAYVSPMKTFRSVGGINSCRNICPNLSSNRCRPDLCLLPSGREPPPGWARFSACASSRVRQARSGKPVPKE